MPKCRPQSKCSISEQSVLTRMSGFANSAVPLPASHCRIGVPSRHSSILTQPRGVITSVHPGRHPTGPITTLTLAVEAWNLTPVGVGQ